MSTKIVLISGPTAELCEGVRGMLAGEPDLDVQVRADVTTVDGFENPPGRPDVLVVLLGADWEPAMRVLAQSQPSLRPPTIAIGPSDDAQLLRRAMQAGVRDYIAPPIGQAELRDAIRRIEVTRLRAASPQGSTLIAVVNVKGGSGASFLAANLAHVIAVQRRLDVGLLDLDLQFGALPLAFDLEQRTTLLEALNGVEQLDPMALRGYMARHDSGVHVLSAMSEQLVLPWEIAAASVTQLLVVLRQTFGVVVVDLPRQIDPLTSAVLTQADRVLMVMQQSLAHARDAKRMQRVLTSTLGVPRERVMLVVNRHSDKQSVRGRDVQETVNPPSMTILPNDFRTVSEAMNIGMPVYDYGRDSAIARALAELVNVLGIPASGAALARKKGLRAVIAHALRS